MTPVVSGTGRAIDCYMDQYMSLLLLYMFNPICTSLRAEGDAARKYLAGHRRSR